MGWYKIKTQLNLLESNRRHPRVSGSSSFLIFILSLEFQKPIDNLIRLSFQILIEMLFNFLLEFLIGAVDAEIALRDMIGDGTWYLRRELVDSLEISNKDWDWFDCCWLILLLWSAKRKRGVLLCWLSWLILLLSFLNFRLKWLKLSVILV